MVCRWSGVEGKLLFIDGFFELGGGNTGNVWVAFVLDVLINYGDYGDGDDGDDNVMEVLLDERSITESETSQGEKIDPD